MKIRPIYYYETNPEILRRKSSLVTLPLSKEDEDTLNYLLEYLRFSQLEENKQRSGVGLAAVQIGVHKKMVAILVSPEHTYQLINPKIIRKSKSMCYLKDGEGCLSVDQDYTQLIPRHYKISVKYTDYPSMTEKVIDLEGYLAIVFQHEIDHLDGRLFIDKISPLFDPNSAIEIS